jgi:hypothetical protein
MPNFPPPMLHPISPELCLIYRRILRQQVVIMFLENNKQAEAEALSLQNAVLCVDCESISTIRFDQCPVCGGRSLLGLARMLGGPLSAHRDDHAENTNVTVLFDVDIAIRLKRVNADEFSASVAGITHQLAPMVGRERATFHVEVEPVVEARPALSARAA